MNVFDKAKQIVANGFQKDEVYDFFTKTNKDIIEYIDLFETLGVSQKQIWNTYEEWQLKPEISPEPSMAP